MTTVLVALLVGGFLVVVVVVLYDTIKGGPAACGVNSRILLPDTCEGGCPVITSGLSMRCVTLTTRPYLIFGTQAASCVSVPPATAGGPPLGATPAQVAAWIASQPGGSGAGGGSGSGAGGGASEETP